MPFCKDTAKNCIWRQTPKAVIKKTNHPLPRTATGDYSRCPVPWCGNDMMTNEGSIAEGLMDVASDDVELLTGQKPMTARELAKNYSYIWENHVTNWKDIR